MPVTPVDEAALRRRAGAVLASLAPDAVDLGRAFADAGHDLALVGGPVRDAFLGRLSTDLDFAASATPEQTEVILARWGDAHWDVGRRFGTIGARRFARDGRDDVVGVQQRFVGHVATSPSSSIGVLLVSPSAGGRPVSSSVAIGAGACGVARPVPR